MSHTVEYYERLNDEQLMRFLQSRNAQYRRLAQIAWQRRVQARAAQNQAAMNTLHSNVSNSNNRVVQGVQNPEILAALRRQNEALQQSVASARQSVAQMQQIYDSRIRALHDQHAQQTDTLMEQIERNRISSENAMQQLQREAKERTDAAVQAVTADMNGRINAVRNEMNTQIGIQRQAVESLQSNFDALVSHITNAEEARAQRIRQARDYLEAASAVISEADRFNQENNHSWQSGKRQSLAQLEQNANNDIKSGADQAAIISSRELFQQALEYRSLVIAEEQRWQIEMAFADNAMDSAENALEAVREIQVEAESEDGLRITETIDVDYWTCGDLTRIKQNLIALRGLMEQPGLTHEQLQDISELAEHYREQIEQAQLFALQARQYSIDREDLLNEAVDYVSQRLGNVHQVWAENYAQDERLGRRVYLQADTGERIVMTAEPVVHDGVIRNEVRYEILSNGRTVHNADQADQFTHDLVDALREVEGIEISPTVCTQQAAPAADSGQSNENIWKRPSTPEEDSARQRVTPAQPTHPLEQQLIQGQAPNTSSGQQ